MTPSQPAHDIQALLDVAVDAIIIIDHRGVIETFNHAAEKLFGYPAAEAVGANVALLMPLDEARQHDEHIRKYLATGVARIIGIGREVEARRKDGSLFPAWLSVGRIEDSDPPRFAGFMQDMTARHQAEEQALRNTRRLAEIARLSEMADLAADIAHEVNQPLAAITNYAIACERLLGQPHPDVGEVRQALKQIADQALRAGSSIHRLREVISNRKQSTADEQSG